MAHQPIYNPLGNPWGKAAAHWLHWQLALEEDDIPWDMFASILWLAIERDPGLYYRKRKQKKSGGTRTLCVPNGDLKRIQTKIDQIVLAAEPRLPYVYGFGGGSVAQALQPHLERGYPIFTADIRDAFPNTHDMAVYNVFRRLGYRKNTAYLLTRLCTWPINSQWRAALPQGAPSSPRLFDLCCRPLDVKLHQLAANVDGSYTRYADNLFFSARSFSARQYRPDEKKRYRGSAWPEPQPLWQTAPGDDAAVISWHATLISAIYRRCTDGYELPELPRKVYRHHWSWLRKCWIHVNPSNTISDRLEYQLHKTYLWHPKQGHAFKALGLQIIDGRLCNSRRYKQRLRLLTHHVSWLLDHHRDFETEVDPVYLQLNGLLQFAVRETLPAPLLTAAAALCQRVEDIRYSGPSHTRVRHINAY
ncbi:hypothetical protein HY933_01140 [Candidatus Falkowbacteria bacterium]|nr:hypothetical protein [Candidatus Falkowbacteria bacterium]